MEPVEKKGGGVTWVQQLLRAFRVIKVLPARDVKGDGYMKKILLGTLAAAAVLSPALAADLPTKAPIVKAPPLVIVFNWTGCYLGGYGGGAWGNKVDTFDPQSTGGAFPAGTFYNRPTANTANGGAFSFDLGSSAIAGGTLGCN